LDLHAGADTIGRMSYAQKSCAQCGNGTFHYMPNMQIRVEFASTMLGMNVSKSIAGQFWTFTLVICDQCGSTQTFTTNGPQLAQWVPGAGTVTATGG
jgi:hypothetical protein